MPRIPALDGLRGVAVVWVLAFHQGFPWARGGFLGVSVFFTLSGFLITSLLLGEHAQSGRIAYGRFLGRRTRRLAPAGIVAIVGTSIAWLLLRDSSLPSSVGGDAAASLLKVANWWFIADEQSYGDLFRAPSPFLHFWSLAIEEQFYLVWPPALLLILRLRSSRARIAAASALLVASASMTFIHSNFDLIYYGSHVRAAELLTGVVLAMAVHSRLPQLASGETRLPSAIMPAAWLGVALWFAATVWLGQGAGIWRHGGLALMGVVSAVIVLGTVVPGSLGRVLAWRPLVTIGAWSYGLYLFHWPVFVFLTADRTGIPETLVFPARLALTVGITAVVRYLVELPIQHRQRLALPKRAGTSYATATAAGLILAVVATSVTPVGTGFDLPSSGPQVFVREEPVPASTMPSDGVIAPNATDPRPVDVGPEPFTVLVVGSRPSGPYGDLISESDDWLRFVEGREVGCPLAPAWEVIRLAPLEGLDRCQPSLTHWPALVAQEVPDAVLVTIGPPDLGLFRLGADDEPLSSVQSQLHLQRSLNASIRALRSFDGLLLLSLAPGLSDPEAARAEWAFGSITRTDPSIRAADSPVERSDLSWLRSAIEEYRGGAAGEGERILVLGDSTAVLLAELIFQESDGRIEAIGLAQEGCPLVHADRMKWWEGAEFDLASCPTADDLRRYMERFTPSVVLIAASLMVQAEVRFGDGPWIEPVSDEFVFFHDLYLENLQEAAVGPGSVVLVLTSPTMPGGGFGGSPMARPARIDAWNAQIARWESTWLNVKSVDWAGALADVEQERGSVRPDGVHVEADVLAELTRDLLLPAIEGTRTWRDALIEAGCLAGDATADTSGCRRAA